MSVLTVLFSVTFSNVVYAQTILTDTAYEFLVNAGTPESYLSTLSDCQINHMYNVLKDEEYVRFSGTNTEKKFMKDSAPSEGITINGAIPSSELDFSVTGYESLKWDSSVSKYKVKYLTVFVDWDWAGYKPTMRWDDAVSVNWDSDLFTYERNSFESTDYYTDGSTEHVWKEWTQPAVLEQGGLGYFASLERNADMNNPVYGNASFTLLPTSSMYQGTTYTTGINANYVHNINPLGLSLGFTVKGVSVSVNQGPLTDSIASALNYKFRR